MLPGKAAVTCSGGVISGAVTSALARAGRAGGADSRGAALAAVDLRQVAVHADEEHIDVCEQPCQILAPGAELDDVLDDQVISRPGQRGQAPVKAGEEPRAHLLPPGERPIRIAPDGQHAARHQMIRRHMQERLGQFPLDRLRQGGLARTGSAIKEDDAARTAISRARFHPCTMTGSEPSREPVPPSRRPLLPLRVTWTG